jgi:hypothetical protein
MVALVTKSNYLFVPTPGDNTPIPVVPRRRGTTAHYASGGNMAKLFPFLFVSALLAGCATAYQRDGLAGGYTETQFGENIFQVSFRGNGYTRGERASDFALLRSAEVATENGFRYFIVVESGKDSSLSTYTTPTQSYTTGSAYGHGNMAYGSATTTTYGGQTYIIRKPSATNTIICFKEKPGITGLVFDAEFVKKSLKQKYGITN